MREERLLWEGRPSFWTQWATLAIGDLFILLAAALWWTEHARWAPWALGACVPFYLAAAARLVAVSYRITDQRVSARSGLFARRVDEVEVGDIRNITLTQTVFERLVGIGTVGVSTAAGDGVEVLLRGVSQAEAVKEAVRAARLCGPPGASVD